MGISGVKAWKSAGLALIQVKAQRSFFSALRFMWLKVFLSDMRGGWNCGVRITATFSGRGP